MEKEGSSICGFCLEGSADMWMAGAGCFFEVYVWFDVSARLTICVDDTGLQKKTQNYNCDKSHDNIFIE